MNSNAENSPKSNKRRRKSERLSDKNMLKEFRKKMKFNEEDVLTIHENLLVVSDRADEYFQKFHEQGILEKILTNLESRRNAAQVNKAFYETVCNIDNKEDIYKLKLGHLNNDHHEILNSIRWSKRAVSEIEISHNYFCAVDNEKRCSVTINEIYFDCILAVLEKFSQSIKKLTIEQCLITDRNFIDILVTLNESPLVELNLITSGIFYSEAEIYPDQLKLPKLKKIDMTGTNFGHPFSYIPEDNLIKKFFASLPNYGQLRKFVAQATILEWMPLDKFYFHSLGILGNEPFRTRISSIINRQYRLKELNLSSTFIMDDVMHEILNLQNLKSLKINCQAVSVKEFGKLAKINTLTSLHLEVRTKKHWLLNAINIFPFVNVVKLSIDVSGIAISMESLRDMCRMKIRELTIKTSQKMALQSVFSSQCGLSLQTLKIEYVFDPMADSSERSLYREIHRGYFKLKSLTLINRFPELIESSDQLVPLLQRFPSLTKIHYEGFQVNEQIHRATLTWHESTLEELTLIDLFNIGGYTPTYTIPFQSTRRINQNKNLKKMVISATHNEYSDTGKFPIIKRVGHEFVFCHR